MLSWKFKCIVYTNKDVLSSERDFCLLVFRVLINDGKFKWFAQNLRVVFCCGSKVDQLCRTISTHWGRDKMAANSWRHFQMHFLEWKYVNFDYDNEIISNKFDDFFINIGPTLAKSIPRINKSPLSYLGIRLTETIYLASVNEKEIGQLIKSSKDTAAGFDDLNSMCLKISSQFLVKPLTHICNLSLSQSIFPEQLKIANVIPLYKSDDSMLFNNYRPVSVLCVLSNIFEKIMYNKVTAFLEIFKILHGNQYGFRKKSWTRVALLTFIDKVIQAIKMVNMLLLFFSIFQRPLILLTIKFCWIN